MASGSSMVFSYILLCATIDPLLRPHLTHPSPPMRMCAYMYQYDKPWPCEDDSKKTYFPYIAM